MNNAIKDIIRNFILNLNIGTEYCESATYGFIEGITSAYTFDIGEAYAYAVDMLENLKGVMEFNILEGEEDYE